MDLPSDSGPKTCSSYKDRVSRILYRAKYRGSKENDFLIGSFIKGLDLVEARLDEVERFLDLDEAYIYDLAFGVVKPNGVLEAKFQGLFSRKALVYDVRPV